jgi:hypothetical protein
MNGCALGAGDRVKWRGEVYYVDSWSPGTGAVWLRKRPYKPGGGFDAEVKAEQIGCYIGFYYGYSRAHPRWRPITGAAFGGARPAPDPDSGPPSSLA